MIGDLQRHVFLCFCCCSTQVWCNDNVWQVEQRAFGCRLHSENIERRTSHMTRFQGRSQRIFINQPTTRTVDNADALFHLGQTFCGDHIGGLFGLWNVQCDEISLFEQLIQFNFGDAHFVGFFFRQERVKGQHFHLEAFGAVTNDSTDVTRTDYTKCFTRQLNTHEFGLFPFARMRGRACFGDLTCHSKHHRNRMFGGCGHVAERGVHHDDTLF